MIGLLMGLLRFLFGVGIGALLGGLIAMLLAPQSGEEFQQKLRDRVEAGKQARDRMEEETRRELEEKFRQMVDDDAALRQPPEGASPSNT